MKNFPQLAANATKVLNTHYVSAAAAVWGNKLASCEKESTTRTYETEGWVDGRKRFTKAFAESFEGVWVCRKVGNCLRRVAASRRFWGPAYVSSFWTCFVVQCSNLSAVF